MRIDMEIHVIQGDKAAFLAEDGSIVEATAENIGYGGEPIFKFKFKDDFKGFANMRLENKSNAYDERNQNNSNNIPDGAVSNSNNSSANLQQLNNNKTN